MYSTIVGRTEPSRTGAGVLFRFLSPAILGPVVLFRIVMSVRQVFKMLIEVPLVHGPLSVPVDSRRPL
jgi:hypothetical protein